MPITWFDDVEITVEAALSAATGTYGAWDAGRWDGATWGTDDLFVDISEFLRSIKTERRFSRGVQEWAPGTARIELLNTDGRFGPANMASPYVVAGVTGVRPWRPIRVRATYAGVTYDIYRGYALDWQESWDPSDAVAVVVVPCIDEQGRLARFNGVTQTPVGAGELAGLRIHRILDNAGYTGPRNIEPGQVTMQATDLSRNAADEIKLVVDSEGGGQFICADGSVCFERQYALMENERSNTIQATFVDANNTGEGLPYHDVVMTSSGDLQVNIAAYARVGGSEQIVADAASRALYADLRDSRTDLVCETDAQVLALATFNVARFKDPEYRPKQIVVKPRANPAEMFPPVLSRRMRDLVRVLRTPREAAYTITRDCHVAGVSHDIARDDWTVTFDLWSASVYRRHSTSRWDVGAWDDPTTSWFF